MVHNHRYKWIKETYEYITHNSNNVLSKASFHEYAILQILSSKKIAEADSSNRSLTQKHYQPVRKYTKNDSFNQLQH